METGIASRAPRLEVPAAETSLESLYGDATTEPAKLGGDGALEWNARSGPSLFQLRTALFFTVILVALFIGWENRGERYLTAESGAGYVLGIVAAALMLLMLLYSARKRLRFMRRWGAVKHWFRIHMLFGILGPTVALFHANFQLGSLNSNVALASMLLVVASGLIGRYIYSRIHYGLFGSRATLDQLRQDTEIERHQLAIVFAFSPTIADRLRRFEDRALAPARNVGRSAARILLIGLWARWIRFSTHRAAVKALRLEARRRRWGRRERRLRRQLVRDYLDVYMATIRRTVQLAFFERLFALWHVLHVPFFVMLALASVVHVVAVHWY